MQPTLILEKVLLFIEINKNKRTNNPEAAVLLKLPDVTSTEISEAINGDEVFCSLLGVLEVSHSHVVPANQNLPLRVGFVFCGVASCNTTKHAHSLACVKYYLKMCLLCFDYILLFWNDLITFRVMLTEAAPPQDRAVRCRC